MSWIYDKRYLGSRCLQDEPAWASMEEPPEPDPYAASLEEPEPEEDR